MNKTGPQYAAHHCCAAPLWQTDPRQAPLSCLDRKSSTSLTDAKDACDERWGTGTVVPWHAGLEWQQGHRFRSVTFATNGLNALPAESPLLTQLWNGQQSSNLSEKLVTAQPFLA